MLLKTGPGSHNRDVIVAKENYEFHEGKTQNCGCLFHRRKNKVRAVIESNDCNRRAVVKTQGWCRSGKTFIDQLKHQGLRMIHVILLSTIETKTIYNSYVNGLFYIESPENLPLKHKFKTILDSVELKEFLSRVKTNKVTIVDYFTASAFLEKELAVSSLGFYNAYFHDYKSANSYYTQLMNDLSIITAVDVLNELKYHFCKLVANSEQQYHIKESSDKSVQYELAEISFSWSKMNNVFMNNNEKIVYRGPFHNTKVKASNCTRMTSYLTESSIKESEDAKNFMANNKKKGHHIDHIIPLALGGRHNVENLQMLTKEANLAKKDRIRFTDYLLIKSDKKDLKNMVCADFYDIMIELISAVGDSEDIFNKVIYKFEQELKIKKFQRQQLFEKLCDKEKFNFVQALREDLSPHGIKKYITRYKEKVTKEMIIT